MSALGCHANMSAVADFVAKVGCYRPREDRAARKFALPMRMSAWVISGPDAAARVTSALTLITDIVFALRMLWNARRLHIAERTLPALHDMSAKARNGSFPIGYQRNQTKAISFARLPRSSSRQDLLSLTSVCSSVGYQIFGARNGQALRATQLAPLRMNDIDRASGMLFGFGQ